MHVIRDVARKCLISSGLVLTLAAPFQAAHAAKFHVVYTFQGGTDASGPIGGLLKVGQVQYGTTYFGGADNQGTVYELAHGGTESVVYSFTGGSDGANPQAGLIADASGNLYGTTYAGGGGSGGCGSVFKLTPGGSESVLYGFSCAGKTGSNPSASLIMDSNGNLFGTTYGGGSVDRGTVFEIASDGTESVVHSFTGGSDGAYPSDAVIEDANGNLFGTTYGGGTAGLGTVFEIAAGGTESVLYAFKGGSDGATPVSSVIEDTKGNLYGTTYSGGSSNCSGSGCGTVFELTAGGTESVLYAFSGGTDGTYPEAGLTPDEKGNLYGATLYGGNTADCGGNGCGTVFKLATNGTKTILHAFAGSDGAQPSARLLAGRKSELYSTTYNGGGSCDCGVIYKIKE